MFDMVRIESTGAAVCGILNCEVSGEGKLHSAAGWKLNKDGKHEALRSHASPGLVSTVAVSRPPHLAKYNAIIIPDISGCARLRENVG